MPQIQDYWRLLDELNVIQIVYLTLGFEPPDTRKTSTDEFFGFAPIDRIQKPSGFEALFLCLKKAISNGELHTIKTETNSDHWYLEKIAKNDIENWLLNQNLKPEFFFGNSSKNVHKPEYLNKNHSMYSEELAAAIETWESVLQCNPSRPKRGSRKSLIANHLKQNYSAFNQSQHDRITLMLNPDKAGGASKTE